MIASYKKSWVRFLLLFLATITSLVLSAVPAWADTYNCGAYGAGTYQNNVCGAATPTPTTPTDSAGGGGGLINTGQSIWLILLAVLLVLLGTYILYRTRKKMKVRTSVIK